VLRAILLVFGTPVFAGMVLCQQLPDAPIPQEANKPLVQWEVKTSPHTWFEVANAIAIPPQRQFGGYDRVLSVDSWTAANFKPMSAASAGAALCSRFLKKKCQASGDGVDCGAWKMPLTLLGMMHGERAGNRPRQPFPSSYRFPY
jgi:hypothetical protein